VNSNKKLPSIPPCLHITQEEVERRKSNTSEVEKTSSDVPSPEFNTQYRQPPRAMFNRIGR
jgi:hypothetical protein